MKQKYIIIISIAAIVIISFFVWQCHIVEQYSVYLHKNYFEFQCYNNKNNTPAELPFEIMLTGFTADTTTNDGTYMATVLLQPRNNISPENITEMKFAPYQVKTYNGYRLYIEEYDYKPSTKQLIVILTVEKRRYQQTIL